MADQSTLISRVLCCWSAVADRHGLYTNKDEYKLYMRCIIVIKIIVTYDIWANDCFV